MGVRKLLALNCKTSLETGRKEELLSHCGRGIIGEDASTANDCGIVIGTVGSWPLMFEEVECIVDTFE
jgi:hypothetical protein